MKCDLILEWLDDYFEGLLDAANQAKFEAHLSKCESCQMLVEDYKCMKEVMLDMPLMALPKDFNESLHHKLLIAAEELKAENLKTGKTNAHKTIQFPLNFKNVIRFVSLAAAIILVVATGTTLKDNLWWNSQNSEQASSDSVGENTLFGVAPPSTPEMARGQTDGSANTTMADQSLAKSMAPTTSSPIAPTPSVQPTPQMTAQPLESQNSRELIKSGEISLKVADFEKFYTSVEAVMNKTGGYIESSFSGLTPYYENDRVISSQLAGNIVLRVPSNQFTAIFETVKKMGVLQSSQHNIQDVTTQISDLNAALENLKVRETRLRELMKQGKNVTEIMQVERELGTVRTQIDQLESNLKLQKQQVSLSTIYINAQQSPEVGGQVKTLDSNLFERAKQALIKNINIAVNGAEILFIAFIAWLPVIIIMALAVFGFSKTHYYRKWRNKK